MIKCQIGRVVLQYFNSKTTLSDDDDDDDDDDGNVFSYYLPFFSKLHFEPSRERVSDKILGDIDDLVRMTFFASTLFSSFFSFFTFYEYCFKLGNQKTYNPQTNDTSKTYL